MGYENRTRSEVNAVFGYPISHFSTSNGSVEKHKIALFTHSFAPFPLFPFLLHLPTTLCIIPALIAHHHREFFGLSTWCTMLMDWKPALFLPVRAITEQVVEVVCGLGLSFRRIIIHISCSMEK